MVLETIAAIAGLVTIIGGLVALVTWGAKKIRKRKRTPEQETPTQLSPIADLVGTALQEAHQLLERDADMSAAVAWGRSKTGMIADAFGLSEAHTFGTNVEGITDTKESRVYLRSRIQRLIELNARLPQLQVRPDFDPEKWRGQNELREPVAEELAEIIDEAKKIRGDVFTELPSGAYETWVPKVSAFIETVFGKIERQRFEQTGEPTQSLNELMDKRIRALEDLRDRPKEWQIRVDRAGLDEAIRERRKYGPGNRIVVAGTQVEFFARQPPNSDAVSETTKTSLQALLTRGRELRGLLDAAPKDKQFEIREQIATWRQEVHDALAADDLVLAEWFVTEEDVKISDALWVRVAVTWANEGGEEQLRLMLLMDQRIAKLERIIHGD